MKWSGRIDGDGPEHARWHQVVKPRADGPHVSLLGFCSDEGVRRNQGRVGAADGPAALRQALGSLSVPHWSLSVSRPTSEDHDPSRQDWSLSVSRPRNEDRDTSRRPERTASLRASVEGKGPRSVHSAPGPRNIVDLGDTTVEGQRLEAAQEEMGRRICDSLTTPGNLLTVVLGGGHETAYASYLGLTAALPVARWGVLNLDAHFDLRSEPRASSGTPFQQMALGEATSGREFRYAVAGISRFANTAVLFERAAELGVEYLLDVDCTEDSIVEFVHTFAEGLDVLYLTVDLDVLPASVAPGVSAPAALGVEARTVLAAVRAAAATGKLRLMDVVELNPRLDVDARTARTAARLIAEAVSPRA